MRVLYVDDDRLNAILFTEACRFADGIEIETASSGAEALALAPDWAPDVLVIDLHLPDALGTSLLPQMRALLQRPRLPAWLCTADDAASATRAAADAGFDGCWTKPADLQAVVRELGRLRQTLERP